MSGGAEFEAGSRIDRYRIVKTIGSGSSGTVYEAVDERLERPVAIKVAAVAAALGEPAKGEPALGDPALGENVEVAARIAREARFAASLSHPNLCPVYDFGIHAGRPYLVMALLPGATLADLIARHAPLAADRIVVLLRPIAEALAEMHRVGLVHGDLKPHNILLDARTEPMLTDFGLARPERFIGRAKPSDADTPAGSPAYRAPEQLRGEPEQPPAGPHAAPRIGPAADMHALGVILYVLLTGRMPFAGTPQETIEKIIDATPTPPSQIATGVSRDLEQICLRLLRKNPSERPSAVEVARRLRLIADRGTAMLSLRPEASESTESASEPANGPDGATDAKTEPTLPTSGPAATEGIPSARRRGPSPTTIAGIVAVLLLPILAYVLYRTEPWTGIATVLSPRSAVDPQSIDSDSDADERRGGQPAERDRSGGGGTGAAMPNGSTAEGGLRSDRAVSPTNLADLPLSGSPLSGSPFLVDEIDPELSAAPGRLFVENGRVVVAAAVLPADPQGNAVAWWSADKALELRAIPAAEIVPVRAGGKIVGVMTSASGDTVAILGESWYGRIAASGGAVVTNPVIGWLTVEQAATSPSGRFALLQQTGLEGRKRISVWSIAEGAHPVDRMAIYCDDSTTTVALSRDGRGLAFGDRQGRVAMQKVVDSGTVLAELEVGGPVTSLAFSPDNLGLAVAHAASDSQPAGMALFQYESAEWKERQRIAVEGAVARTVTWSPDGAWLCGVLESTPPPSGSETPGSAADRARFAEIWRVDGTAPPLRIPDVAGTAIAFVEPELLVAGHRDGLVRRWRLPSQTSAPE